MGDFLPPKRHTHAEHTGRDARLLYRFTRREGAGGGGSVAAGTHYGSVSFSMTYCQKYPSLVSRKKLSRNVGFVLYTYMTHDAQHPAHLVSSP